MTHGTRWRCCSSVVRPSLAGAAAQALAAIGDREAVAILVEAAQGGFRGAPRGARGARHRRAARGGALMLDLIEDGAPVEQRTAAGYFAQASDAGRAGGGAPVGRKRDARAAPAGTDAAGHAATPEAP